MTNVSQKFPQIFSQKVNEWNGHIADLTIDWNVCTHLFCTHYLTLLIYKENIPSTLVLKSLLGSTCEVAKTSLHS